MDFRGKGLALDDSGLNDAVQTLGIGPAEFWAVMSVESRGCGFSVDRRPKILYERHWFHKLTNGAHSVAYPDVSNSERGGYTRDKEYERLEKAISLDRKAALESTSWGVGQVMGFNFAFGGFNDAESMVTAMMESENAQITAMAGFIKDNKLDSRLKNHDWEGFAKGYNGTGYKESKYDTKLADAFSKFSAGPLPDLPLRTAQLYLTYLGYDPGPVDGLWGKRTKDALVKYRTDANLPAGDQLDAGLAAHISSKALSA